MAPPARDLRATNCHPAAIGLSCPTRLSKPCLSVWTNELLPLDILPLALTGRDDDPHALCILISLLDRQKLQQRVKLFCLTRGPPEHWLHTGVFKRFEPQKTIGNLSSLTYLEFDNNNLSGIDFVWKWPIW